MSTEHISSWKVKSPEIYCLDYLKKGEIYMINIFMTDTFMRDTLTREVKEGCVYWCGQ